MTVREHAQSWAKATLAAAVMLLGAWLAFYRFDSQTLATLVLLVVGAVAAVRLGAWGAYAVAWAVVATIVSAGFVAEIGNVEVRGRVVRLDQPATLELSQMRSEWQGTRRMKRKPAAVPVVGVPTMWAVCPDLSDDPRGCTSFWGDAVTDVVLARRSEQPSYVSLLLSGHDDKAAAEAAAEVSTFVYWTPPQAYTTALWADVGTIVGAAAIGWVVFGLLALGATAVANRGLYREDEDPDV